MAASVGRGGKLEMRATVARWCVRAALRPFRVFVFAAVKFVMFFHTLRRFRRKFGFKTNTNSKKMLFGKKLVVFHRFAVYLTVFFCVRFFLQFIVGDKTSSLTLL